MILWACLWALTLTYEAKSKIFVILYDKKIHRESKMHNFIIESKLYAKWFFNQNGSFCIKFHLDWSKFVVYDMNCICYTVYLPHPKGPTGLPKN